MSTFRHTHKPKLRVIDYDMNGVIDLEESTTIIHITVPQSQTLSSIINKNHLIDGQEISIENRSAASVFVSSILIEDETQPIEIKPDQVGVYRYLNGLLFSLGDTADLEKLRQRVVALETAPILPEVNWYENYTEVSTSSTSLVNLLSYQLADMSPGQYLFIWNYEWNLSSTNYSLVIQVDATNLYGTIRLGDHVQEPQDSATTQRHTETSFSVFNHAAQGNIDLSFKYRVTNSAAIARIKKLKLLAFKLSNN